MDNRVPPRWTAYALATAAPLIATPIALGVHALLPKGNVSLIYLIAVLVVAVRTSPRPALLCAVVSFLAYNFFFTEPQFTLLMMHREDMLTVGFFLLLAAITGHMAARLREQFIALRGREAVNRAQFTLSERLSAAIDKREIAGALCEALRDVVADRCFVLDAGGAPDTPLAGDACPPELAPAVRRVAESNRPATETVGGRSYDLQPVNDQNGVTAVLGLSLPHADGADAAGDRAVVDALVKQASLALGRTQLVSELQTERLEKERELLRSALLSSISHDLRTPLSAMIGSTTTLIDLDASLDAEQKRELLDAVLEEARRLDRYIQNLLDMTRLGYQGLRMDRDWIGLDEIVHVTLKRIQPLARDHTIEYRLPADLPPLHVHAALIEQAIFNVLENAVKYSDKGTAILIEARRAGDEIQIDITDRGPGIGEAQRATIFDMFVTGTQGDRHGGGTGLGLAICQGVVNAHGGRVEALDGAGGKGLTVRLTLPVVPYAESAPQPEEVE